MTETLVKKYATENAYESNQILELIDRLQISHVNILSKLNHD